MKTFIFSIGFLFSLFPAQASIIDTLALKSKITDVTVFFSGAQIKRTADLKINKGKAILLFDKLAIDIAEKSVQVQSILGCKILSVKCMSRDMESANKSKEEKALESIIEEQNRKMFEIESKLEVFNMEEKLLIDNSLLSKKNVGNQVLQIQTTADFYRQRFNEINLNKLNLMKESNALAKQNAETYKQLSLITAKRNMPYTQVYVTIEAENNINAKMALNYYLSSAAWNPQYDFRVDHVTKPLNIVYNAIIYQSTGEDWHNVNLKLSTINPSLSNEKPKLETWYLGNNTYQSKTYHSYNLSENKSNFGALKVKIRDQENQEPISFATIVVLDVFDKQVNVGMSDMNGEILFKPIKEGEYKLKVMCVGYTPQQVDIKVKHLEISNTDIFMFGSQMLQEVQIVSYSEPLISKDVKSSGKSTAEEYRSLATKTITSAASIVTGVNIRGGRSSGKSLFVDGERLVDLNLYTELKELKPNLEYTINVPSTILSDGNDNMIRIKDSTVPTHYVYYASPKIDKDVFIQANVADWTKLNLLSASSSVYLLGTYTGESEIDIAELTDTLQLSLGREKNIHVQRDRIHMQSEKRLFGNTIKETFTYEINIKNNNTHPIKLLLEDQYPVSEREAIEVELEEISGAKKNEKTGKLTWELILEPNSKKAVSYQYKVKYPKYLDVSFGD
jgi:hypothetical protein